MKPNHIVAVVAASVLIMSTEGLAWGRDGHQVIANLAQSRLSPAAKTGVAALLHGATSRRCRPRPRMRLRYTFGGCGPNVVALRPPSTYYLPQHQGL